MSLLVLLQNTLDDATFIIKKEKKEEARRSEASGALYNTLLSYIESVQKQTAVQRCTLQAKLLQQRVNWETPDGTHNIIRLYEKALRSQKALSLIDKDCKDNLRLAYNELNEMYFSTLIAYLITLHYYANKKYTEAFAMQ